MTNTKTDGFAIAKTNRERSEVSFDGTLLKKVAAEQGVTMYRISKGTGITQGTLSRLVRNQIPRPRYCTLAAIAHYLEVPIEDIAGSFFLKDSPSDPLKEHDTSPIPKSFSSGSVPLVNPRAAAKDILGSPGFPVITDPVGQMRQFIPCPFDLSSVAGMLAPIAFQMSGNAMSPGIIDGDYVYTAGSVVFPLALYENGKLYACVIGEGENATVTVRRLEKGEGDDYWLIADNPDWRGRKEVKNAPLLYEVIGVVRAYASKVETNNEQ